MNKISVKLRDAYRLVNPGVVVLVSSGDEKQDNLFTVAWNMPVRKDPPMLGLVTGKGHHSWPLIQRSGEFGVNVPDAALMGPVLGCGKVSGRDLPDKFARFGLTRQQAELIRAPLVQEAVANLECRICQVVDLGASALLLAQVVRAVAAEQHFSEGQWQFEHGLQLLHHLGGDRFCCSDAPKLASVPE